MRAARVVCWVEKLAVNDCLLIFCGGIGTFARVWLVRLANPRPEDRDKVFALKVLRKVEGKILHDRHPIDAPLLMIGSYQAQAG